MCLKIEARDSLKDLEGLPLSGDLTSDPRYQVTWGGEEGGGGGGRSTTSGKKILFRLTHRCVSVCVCDHSKAFYSRRF